MFLNQLNAEEKELFLELAANAVQANGVFEQDEMETVARLCYEMMVPNHLPNTEKPLDQILNEINEIATAQEKNMILFELIMLLRSDEEADQKELNLSGYVAYKLDISDDKSNHLHSLARIRQKLNTEITALICQD